ncbi:hypothetical protein, partial [Salidesulfovibrio brasiliensis]|uniref:hypothetical protein n=1 Tax=Salidesulfovibrio brasiliensis TaxID=221711 RepID=UPI001C45148E
TTKRVPLPVPPAEGEQESHRYIARGHADSYRHLDFLRESFALYERVTFCWRRKKVTKKAALGRGPGFDGKKL